MYKLLFFKRFESTFKISLKRNITLIRLKNRQLVGINEQSYLIQESFIIDSLK